MTSTLIPFLVALTLSAPVQENYDTYGKTEAEILAMGRTKWNEFFSSKAGDSTAAMSGMNAIYGVVERHRNDRMLAASSDEQLKKKVAKLRSLLTDYANQCIEIGSNESGGGTMWNPIAADIEANEEDVIYGIVGGDAQKRNPIVVSKVKSELALVKASIEREHADKDSASYFKYKEAKASFADLTKDLEKVVAVAMELNRANSDRVLYYCFDYAQMAENANKEH